MSDALRKELVGTGVKVTNILPGVCNTQMGCQGAKTKEEVFFLSTKYLQCDWQLLSNQSRQKSLVES